MSLSGRNPGGTTAAVTAKFVPALFSKQVAEVMHNNLVCYNLVNSEFRSELVKGNILYIPKSQVSAAAEVVVGTMATSHTSPLSASPVTLTIDQWYESVVPVDDMTAQQTQGDIFAIAKRETAYALAKVIDTSINTLFSTLNGSTVIGADGVAISDDVLLSAWETLMEADVPPEQIALIVDPSAVVDFFKQEKMINQMYGTQGAVTNGFKGYHKVYGIPVYMTNNLVAASTGSYAAMLHKDAIACVAQDEPSSKIVPEPREHQSWVMAEALWGVIEVRDGFGVPIYTRKA
jgi:hypothetical protein